MTDTTTNSGSESLSDPQPEDLASREDLLLAYDRLSREQAPITRIRACNTDDSCTVFERGRGHDIHSHFPDDLRELRTA